MTVVTPNYFRVHFQGSEKIAEQRNLESEERRRKEEEKRQKLEEIKNKVLNLQSTSKL